MCLFFESEPSLSVSFLFFPEMPCTPLVTSQRSPLTTTADQFKCVNSLLSEKASVFFLINEMFGPKINPPQFTDAAIMKYRRLSG